jgi:hypothetical protein
VRLIAPTLSVPAVAIPPAGFDAVIVSDDAELAPNEAMPANVSLINTAAEGSLKLRLEAFVDPDVEKSIPPVPAVRLTVALSNAPVALMPPAAFDALSNSDDAEPPVRATAPARVSLISATPDVFTVSVVAFNEPEVLMSIPAVPAIRLTVAEAMAPVPLIPPAASEAFSDNEPAEPAPTETTPANVSLMLTAPAASLKVSREALVLPVVEKSMPALPAVRLTVAAFKLPVAVIPLLAFEAIRVKALAEPPATATVPAKESVMVTLPVGLLTLIVLAFVEPLVVKSMPPVPADKLVIGVDSKPVPLMPPAGSEAVIVND